VARRLGTIEQRQKVSRRVMNDGRRKRHVTWILRFARQKSRHFCLSLFVSAPEKQPVRALRNPEAANRNKQSGNYRRGIHPAPGAEFRNVLEHEITHEGPDQRAQGLKAKRAEHEAPAHRARDAFGDYQMRGRVMASKRDAEPEQENDQPDVAGAEN